MQDTKTTALKEVYQLRTPQDIKAFYDHWGNNYEADNVVEGYNGPTQTAEFGMRFLRPGDRILDVCGGTGLVVQALKGSWDIDVIDASETMLLKAKEKGYYRNYYCEFVKEEGSSISSGAYDAVISCGAFHPGALDHSHLPEIARYVRSGGLVIVGGRKKWLIGGLKESEYNWNGEVVKGMEELAENGVWQLVAKEEKEDYCSGQPGLYFVWRKL